MASPSQKLVVNIIQAEGLQHMNHFTGDHPYVVCEVQRLDPSLPKIKAETKPVKEGDTSNPAWNETLELEPWVPGEALTFTVYDKGLLGSKTEGRALLPSEFFYPNAFNGWVNIIGLTDAKLRLEISPSLGARTEGEVSAAMPMTEEAPPTDVSMSATCAEVPASTDEAPAPAASITYAAPQEVATPSVVQPEQFQLSVSMLQAHGLKHMNHFTGDHPYATCQVKHLDESKEAVKVETKPATEGDMLNPFWGETHTLSPWSPGETLEFTVYDKGLIGAKTEGKVLLPPDIFYPQGFSGMLAISGLPHALLHVIIRPLGAMVTEAPAEEIPVTDAAKSSKKKKKKVKVSKKTKVAAEYVVSTGQTGGLGKRSLRKVAV